MNKEDRATAVEKRGKDAAWHLIIVTAGPLWEGGKGGRVWRLIMNSLTFANSPHTHPCLLTQPTGLLFPTLQVHPTHIAPSPLPHSNTSLTLLSACSHSVRTSPATSIVTLSVAGSVIL